MYTTLGSMSSPSWHGTATLTRDRDQIFNENKDIFGDSPRTVTTENYQFPGTKEATTVAPYHVLIRIVWACKGKFAKDFQARCAKLICRVFAGDATVAEEIRVNCESLDVQSRTDLTKDIPEAGLDSPAISESGTPTKSLTNYIVLAQEPFPPIPVPRVGTTHFSFGTPMRLLIV